MENTEIQALHAEVKSVLAQTRSRAARVAVVLWLLIIVIAGYWFYLYSRIDEVNAESLSDIAMQKTVEYARSAPPELSQAIRDQAPQIFNYMEGQVLAAPALVCDQIQKAALQQTQMVLANATLQINALMDKALAEAKTAMLNAGVDGKDPAQLTKFIDILAEKIRSGVAEDFGRIYKEYDARAQEAVDYLQKMAEGKQLDARQKHLREVMVSFLAVAEKRKSMP